MTLLSRLGLLVLVHGLLVAGALEVGAQRPTRQIAYEGRVGSTTEIFLLDVDRSLVSNLTKNPGIDGHLHWSPDGRLLAFESWRNSVRGVYVMAADGSQVRRLSAISTASDYNTQWTPDGRLIKYQSYWRYRSSDISLVLQFQVNPNGSGLQLVDTQKEFDAQTAPRFTSKRAANGQWGFYQVEGDNTRWVANSPVLYAESPRWSPDSQQIAFISMEYSGATEIYVLDADGTHLRQVTSDGIPKSNLHWRP